MKRILGIFKDINSFKISSKIFSSFGIFIYQEKALFEVIFLILYSLEQLILVLLVYFSSTVSEVSFYVSIFAIIILTTFNLHKFMMESRISRLEENINLLSSEKQRVELLLEYLRKEYLEIVRSI